MQEIDLQDFIYQVKRELLTPNSVERAKDPFPLFVIDKIELEIAVKVIRTVDGSAKVTVLGFAEIGGGASIDSERGNVVRVSLSPILTHEEVVASALKDERIHQMVQYYSGQAFIKGEDKLVGKPE